MGEPHRQVVYVQGDAVTYGQVVRHIEEQSVARQDRDVGADGGANQQIVQVPKSVRNGEGGGMWYG